MSEVSPILLAGLKDLKGVSATRSLSTLGMDSILSVNIKQTLERDFKIYLTQSELRALTFTKLQEMVGENYDNEEMILDEGIDV